jgi:class 3 adenylate cyclase
VTTPRGRIGRQVEEMAREAVASNRGALIKEMGDGLMAAFSSARRAITAARDMQVAMRRLHRGGLDPSVQMRIGLHTGEVIDEDGDLHGETVIIAKRIEGLAPPGGVLASETVHGVLGTARDELVDQGAAELKGISLPTGACTSCPCRLRRTRPSPALPTPSPRRTSGGPPSARHCARCSNRQSVATADSS